MPVGKLMEGWTFHKTLPDPFEDYTDDAVRKDVHSKYCTQPQKRSTLHAATLRAVLSYMELESSSGSTPMHGAIGSQGNNFTIAEYPSRTGKLHVVVYNRNNGKFIAGCYVTTCTGASVTACPPPVRASWPIPRPTDLCQH